jgi:hypothetical protein
VILEGESEQTMLKVKMLDDSGTTVELDKSAVADWLQNFFTE